MEMLKIWLRQGEATRQILIAALQSECVNYPDIAKCLLVSHSDQKCEANAMSSAERAKGVGNVHYKSI